ncbi:hypothetical protein KEM56_004701, partial [Ascosphaera pollenicola]
MAKQPKQLTTDELLAQFDSLNVDVPATTTADAPDKPDKPEQEQDILAELQDLAAQRPTSRPDTPRQSSTLSRQEKTKPVEKTAPRASQEKEKTAEKTAPPPPADDTHDTQNTQETPQSQSTSTATATESSSSGGSWWGGLFATASAAVKQAEAAVKDIQQNEDAQRWAEQVKGRVGGLKGL